LTVGCRPTGRAPRASAAETRAAHDGDLSLAPGFEGETGRAYTRRRKRAPPIRLIRRCDCRNVYHFCTTEPQPGEGAPGRACRLRFGGKADGPNVNARPFRAALFVIVLAVLQGAAGVRERQEDDDALVPLFLRTYSDHGRRNS